MRKLCFELVNEFTFTAVAQDNALCILQDLIRNCLKHQTNNRIFW